MIMPVNVLIIEGAEAFLTQLATRMASGEFRIFAATEPVKAIKLLTKKNIDVVLLGLGSLRREGLDLLRAIKRLRPLTEVITINDPDHLSFSIEGMKLGAFDDFLVPLDLRALGRRVREASGRKALRTAAGKSWLRRCQDAMTASAFAEEGDVKTAREILFDPHED